MSDGTALAQKIQEEVLTLPEESLPELEKFIERLRSNFQAQDAGQTEPARPLKIVKLRGILKGYDFSPEFIAEARREMWRKFHVEDGA